MLIEDYDLDVFTPPCDPGAETWSAIARLKVDISEVLPYLHAVLPGSRYHPAAKALTWQKVDHSAVFHPYEIAASNLEDRVEAEHVIAELIKTVNHTWEQRAGLEPNFEIQQRPTPMAIFKLLPGTNCKQCGQPTCFNFALKLATGQSVPADCPPMLEAEFAENLSQLQALIGPMSTND